MPVSDAIHLVLDGALGFGAIALTLSMMAALAVWFTCSVVQNVAKAGRLVSRPGYDALLRENERLRDSLADAREENDYLRSLYRDLLQRDLPVRAGEERQDAASRTFGVNCGTKIEVNDEEATLADIQVSDKVQVQVKAEASETSLTARQLQVEDESAEDPAPAA
jgi:hypothetical protein